MALETTDQNPLTLHVSVDASGALAVHHGADNLADHGDSVIARTDDASLRVQLMAPAGWSLTAAHEDDDGEGVDWNSDRAGASYAFNDPTTDPLEIELEATQSGDKKKTKIYIEAKPGGALPDKPEG